MSALSVSIAEHLVVELDCPGKLESLIANFDCYKREDASDEIVIDTVIFDGASDESFRLFCSCLGLDIESDDAQQFLNSGYVSFYV